jgi:hypothetical protein
MTIPSLLPQLFFPDDDQRGRENERERREKRKKSGHMGERK